ncbi:MAG: amino acid permease [Acidobacteria bacterium RIFCSPLOWO2_02_FULL_61_28]|nr:MAG: amino acid permease [Acidobacteria bacterium RIFCSPLOWO2_02_FULL_61_28]
MSSQLFRTKSLALLLEEMKGEQRLRRVLGPVALTSLGVGCIIGTGIFVLTGVAAHDKAGPALTLSFVMAGMACVFAALCYAEFASMVPVAGSAYTYAYATLGELIAWIIGWDLVLEYSVASATVAHGWSAYFRDFLGLLGIRVPPEWSGAPFDYAAGGEGFRLTGAYFDVPAVAIAVLVTIILVKGIRESASVNAAMVITKVAVVFFVIIVGAFYVNRDNWQPFAPFGYGGLFSSGEPKGMLAGAALVFFAYIGFDSVSTHAEEARNPQRDVPIGILVSLVLCTILYIAVALVLTGMVRYDQIDIHAPVSNAFIQRGITYGGYLISLGAMTGITSVLLVLMLSQPRVLLAMARDGLLPRSFFGAIHDRFRTPWKSTILTGIFVGTAAALIPLHILAELVNIGTLLAFVIVCAAVLVMRKTNPHAERPFRAPLFPWVPILGILFCLTLMFSLGWHNWLRLFVWLMIGMVIYVAYGRRHSVLSDEAQARAAARPKPGMPSHGIGI